jgi:hypothetical protein
MITEVKKKGGAGDWEKHLPSKHKALNSNPNIAKKIDLGDTSKDSFLVLGKKV